jgi:signal transduction histidine kinase
MSHELRTPLNAILGFGQLLESDTEHPLSASQKDNLQEIMQGGEHLLELINEVLDLARIESGRLELEFEPIPAIPLIDACIRQIQPEANRRGIRIFHHPCVPFVVDADATRFKEVLFNLLSNAVKYNREGGSVEVRCSANGERMRISVQDSGYGIPAESLPRLFRPFERLEPACSGIDGKKTGRGDAWRDRGEQCARRGQHLLV